MDFPPVLRRVMTAFVLCLILLSVIGPWGLASASVKEYNQFRGDNANSGVCGSTGAPLPELSWKFKADGKLESSPVVAGDKVYFGSKDRSVYCVDRFSGNQVWRFPTEGDISCTPLVKSGKCYIGSGDKRLYCLNAEYGTDQWSFETQGQILSSPKYYKDRLFFGSDDGKLYAIWAENGTESWNFSMSEGHQEFWSSAAIDKGMLFIGDANGRFVVLDTEDGSLVAEEAIAGDIYTSACLYEDSVIIVTGTGKSVLRYRFTEDKTLEKVWEFKTPKDVYTSAAVFNGSVYFADYDSVFAAPFDDPDDSGEIEMEELVWKYDFTPGIPNYKENNEGGSSPLVLSDRLVIGTKEYLHCIYLDNGTQVWKFEIIRGGLVSSPVYVDHNLYVTASDSQLFCFTGRDLATAVEDNGTSGEDEGFDPYLQCTVPIGIFLVLDLVLFAAIIAVVVKRRGKK